MTNLLRQLLPRLLLLALLTTTFWSPASAANSNFKERKGGKDHPLVSRFQGAILHNDGVINFEQVKVPLSATTEETVEGKIYNYFYVIPADRTGLEVFRNYKAALEKSGFQILVACEAERECEKQRLDRHSADWTGRSESWVGGYDPLSRIDQNGSYPPRYLAARLKRAAGDVTVLLMTRSPSSVQKDSGVGGPYFLQVIEAKPMETGNVTVNATAMASGLAADGKMALYGIYFDTAKSELKPDSRPQLEEMAKLLNSQKSLKVYIVGHTDNQGTLDANLALSQKRADAIVAALVKDYKIDAKRMQARGAASFSPVASNRSDAGRARNRRVELVEQ
jgi:outer membrane protein OmpA-like peptidoglycan-associated protein